VGPTCDGGLKIIAAMLKRAAGVDREHVKLDRPMPGQYLDQCARGQIRASHEGRLQHRPLAFQLRAWQAR